MVTEGPESLVELSRDPKEVRPGLLGLGVVLKGTPPTQGSGQALLVGGGQSCVTGQGLDGS